VQNEAQNEAQNAVGANLKDDPQNELRGGRRTDVARPLRLVVEKSG